MNRNVEWNGVYPAVLTMFHENGDIDFDMYLKNINAQVDAGVQGIIIGGSLGESSTITHQDRLDLLKALPIILYNNPVDYKIEITMDMFDQLQDVPNIKASKESTRDISNVSRMKSRFGDRFKILCGVDTLALEELLMGADGWVAGLVDAFPEETVAIYRLAKVGRVAEAIDIYRWFLPILELDINPQLVQNIKLAAVHTGIGSEHVRRPRKPLIGAERERVLKVIKDGLDTRPQLPEYKSIEV